MLEIKKKNETKDSLNIKLFSRKMSKQKQVLFTRWCRPCMFFVIYVSVLLLVFKVDGLLFELLCPGFVFCSFIVLLYDYSLSDDFHL